MRFGLDITQHQLEWDEIVSRAGLAEDAGFDGVWVFDHFSKRSTEPEGPVSRGVDAPGRARARDDQSSAGNARDRDDTSDPLGPGGGGRDGRPLVERSRGVRRWRRVERGRASRARDPVPVDARPDGPPGRGRAGDEAALHPGRRDVRGAPGAGGARHVSSAARPDSASPDLDGGTGRTRTLPMVGRYADAWHGHADDADELRTQMDIIDTAATGAGRDPSSILRASSLSISEPWDEVKQGLRVDGRRGDRLPRRNCRCVRPLKGHCRTLGWASVPAPERALFAAGDHA